MEYRLLGNSGLRVSALSIGGWLTLGKSVEDTTSHDILRAAIAGGINFIDVADIYAIGESERVVGEVIVDYKRSDLVISSKVFWPMSDNPNDQGLSRKHIMESIDKSLGRLQTDYLDIYFCHRWDLNSPLLETMRAMDDLIHRGKILYWGTSMWSADQLRDAHALAERYNLHAPIVEQPRYNLIHRDIEQDVLPTCVELGMGLTIWSPLAQGMLTGKYNQGVPDNSRAATSSWLESDLTEENLARVRRFCETAERLGHRPEQLALAWLLKQEGISSVITGATRTEQVHNNLAAAHIALDEAVLAEIATIF
ncbi:MAG: aldo/keto reductase family protein [Bradymonadaceae bacterium]|nr:aldo/keto reductase family protein [Lujinxingiaceae bacterium]